MRRHAAMLAVVVMALVAPLVLVAPEALLLPFAAQSEGDASLAFQLRQLRPWLTLLLAVAGASLTARSWKSRRSWSYRAVTSIPVLVLVVSAVLARQNLFEWMFAPVSNLRFVEVSDARHVEPGDMVLGVRIGDDAKAYPVRLLGYYHVVNDQLGSEPYVVTY